MAAIGIAAGSVGEATFVAGHLPSDEKEEMSLSDTFGVSVSSCVRVGVLRLVALEIQATRCRQAQPAVESARVILLFVLSGRPDRRFACR